MVERLPFGVVMASFDGRVRIVTSRAKDLLARFFSRCGSYGDRLPAELARWLHHERGRLGRAAGEYRPLRPFVSKCDGRQLTVRALLDADRYLLVLEEHVTSLHPQSLESLGLTRREAEVLVEVIGDKTNREIAEYLGMSPRTVATHLDHIFYKFDVTTRTAAARFALDAAMGGE